jgi:hypothetical protein
MVRRRFGLQRAGWGNKPSFSMGDLTQTLVFYGGFNSNFRRSIYNGAQSKQTKSLYVTLRNALRSKVKYMTILICPHGDRRSL